MKKSCQAELFKTMGTGTVAARFRVTLRCVSQNQKLGLPSQKEVSPEQPEDNPEGQNESPDVKTALETTRKT